MSRRERPDVDIGDILDWQGCPVLVLETPFWLDEAFNMKWVAPVVYLNRDGAKVREMIKPGQRLPHFRVEDKERWTKPLTDEEERLAMESLLTGGKIWTDTH